MSERDDYTTAWLSEMWPTVREYRDGDPLPKRKKPRKPREARNAPRDDCPICGIEYTAAYVPAHIIRRHPESVQNPVEMPDRKAS